jgi:hypothetical protein
VKTFREELIERSKDSRTSSGVSLGVWLDAGCGLDDDAIITRGGSRVITIGSQKISAGTGLQGGGGRKCLNDLNVVGYQGDSGYVPI